MQAGYGGSSRRRPSYGTHNANGRNGWKLDAALAYPVPFNFADEPERPVPKLLPSRRP